MPSFNIVTASDKRYSLGLTGDIRGCPPSEFQDRASRRVARCQRDQTQSARSNQIGAVVRQRASLRSISGNPDGTERVTTVELIVERAVIQKRDDPIVMFKIKQEELELRRLAMARGAKYDGRNYMWRLCRSEVLRMGLKSWIAVTDQDPGQEQVRP